MNNLCLEHVSEELLERFLAGQASESESEIIETHLLICESCQEQLDELEDYRTAMRNGFALLKSEERQVAAAISPVQKESWARQFVFGLLNWRLPQWSVIPVAAALALACVLVLPTLRHSNSPVELTLTAERGNAIPTVTLIAGRPLELHLNASGLSQGPMAVEVVDSEGGLKSQQNGVVRSNQVDVLVGTVLPKGIYLARIYATENGELDPNRLLREFTFQVM